MRRSVYRLSSPWSFRRRKDSLIPQKMILANNLKRDMRQTVAVGVIKSVEKSDKQGKVTKISLSSPFDLNPADHNPRGR